MKIKTQRQWTLELAEEMDCIRVMEIHDKDTPYQDRPYVMIPEESLGSVIKYLRARQRELKGNDKLFNKLILKSVTKSVRGIALKIGKNKRKGKQ